MRPEKKENGQYHFMMILVSKPRWIIKPLTCSNTAPPELREAYKNKHFESSHQLRQVYTGKDTNNPRYALGELLFRN